MSDQPARCKKVAVIGGGLGGLSAAFYLTEQPDWADKYDITIYQQGWRLGGKCASGRDTRPGYGYRIYEHGLHIFAGFYDQAFHMLRRAYEELQRPEDHPNRTVWDAFTPSDEMTLVDPERNGFPMSQWHLNLPANDLRPGDEVRVPPLLEMVHRMVELLQSVMPLSAAVKAGRDSARRSRWLSPLLKRVWARLRRLVRGAEAGIEDRAIDLALHRLVDTLHEQMKLLGDPASTAAFEIQERRFIEMAFMAQAVIHGIAADEVPEHGFDVLDKYEWSEWVHRNAVAVGRRYPEWGDPQQRADDLVRSPIVRSGYDYAFALEDGGDASKPNLAAGTALRAAFLLMFYKGHFFWKMRGAMGDVVIAPLYLALRKRGVKFRFFHQITSLNIDRDTASPHSVDFVTQAKLKDQAAGYQPLIDAPVPGWPADQPLESWPAEPLWDQVANADALKACGPDFETAFDSGGLPGEQPGRLMQGLDFDLVVLAAPPGVQRTICSGFADRLPGSKWKAMLKQVTLTATCAMQLWFRRDMADLGCEAPDRALTGAEQKFSSWADMSHLLSRECWSADHRPRSIVYSCGQLPGGEPDDPPLINVNQEAARWLANNAATFWPRAVSADSAYGLAPDLLFTPPGADTEHPLSVQFIRANLSPTNLYVQSPKNSVHSRMDANESGLQNLFLAGDWTRNGINAGCVEAAVRSGVRCSQAIAGDLPPLEH